MEGVPATALLNRGPTLRVPKNIEIILAGVTRRDDGWSLIPVQTEVGYNVNKIPQNKKPRILSRELVTSFRCGEDFGMSE